MYLPGRIERLPLSSTLDSERGSISSVTSLLVPPATIHAFKGDEGVDWPVGLRRLEIGLNDFVAADGAGVGTETVAVSGSPAFSESAESLTGPYLKVE